MATNPQVFDFDIGDVTGKKGDTGNGISGIELLSTSGLQKTYRINTTNETHFDFVVTDGNGISGASFDADTNELTITFDNGTSFTTPSLKGNPGDDGYSPAVTIETITGGHRVTITDKDHPTGQSFDVMDGAPDAGSVSYDPEETYQSGTVGAELQHQSRHLSDLEDSISDAYDATASYAVGDFCINENTLYRCNTAIPTGGEAWTPAHWDAVQIVDLLGSGGGDVTDVQINGTSILSDGVANIPYIGRNVAGVAKTNSAIGLAVNASGELYVARASNAEIKSGNQVYCPIVPTSQHSSVFYGLAKAAGDTTQAQSSNPVGTYTDEAKVAIKSMLGVADGGGMNIVNLSGTQITQVGADNTFYVCGELTELTFTAPAVGITMIRFTSGTTPTVLTVTGVTAWMFDFDPTVLEANTTYDISVLNGIGVAGWA